MEVVVHKPEEATHGAASIKRADTWQAFGRPATIYLAEGDRIDLRTPLLVALIIICPQASKLFSVLLSWRLEHASARIKLDADLLLILRNGVPNLSGFFDRVPRSLEAVSLGLLTVPIREP
jgi:hypothetical protein